MGLLNVVFPTPALSVEKIESATASASGSVVGRFRDLTLHSHFQPIISLAHRRVVGYEGLVRPCAADGRLLAPGTLFESVDSTDDVVFLDRLSRNIHARNFVAAGREDAWLFLNVNARVAMHGKGYGPYFESMLARCGLPPHRVVIELVENDVPDESLLAEAMRYYTELGCLVAIDDFGAGHSNFERIWRVQPQIVKLDRSTLVQARESRKVRRILPNLVALLHEAGCMTLIEGVEDEADAMLALDAGVDFAQGFFFARPTPAVEELGNCISRLGGICDRHAELARAHRERSRVDLEPYIIEFRECAGLVGLESNVREASTRMLALPNVLRCYVLDGDGRQLGDNIVPSGNGMGVDRRFSPVANPGDAVWSRRPYFQRAMADPGQVQISRPYLSITDARMCVTISISIKNVGKQDRVYCADILWDEGTRRAG
jgi:EAL domain-containing protein (putative c-di-GMP-specific phosphodiesterase class I)